MSTERHQRLATAHGLATASVRTRGGQAQWSAGGHSVLTTELRAPGRRSRTPVSPVDNDDDDDVACHHVRVKSKSQLI